MAAGFVGLFGLVGCQQQTSNTNATVKVSSEATASAYSSGGSVATTDYAYSDAQPDNVNLDLVMTLEDAARFENRIGIGAPLKRVNSLRWQNSARSNKAYCFRTGELSG